MCYLFTNPSICVCVVYVMEWCGLFSFLMVQLDQINLRSSCVGTHDHAAAARAQTD